MQQVVDPSGLFELLIRVLRDHYEFEVQLVIQAFFGGIFVRHDSAVLFFGLGSSLFVLFFGLAFLTALALALRVSRAALGDTKVIFPRVASSQNTLGFRLAVKLPFDDALV